MTTTLFTFILTTTKKVRPQRRFAVDGNARSWKSAIAAERHHRRAPTNTVAPDQTAIVRLSVPMDAENLLDCDLIVVDGTSMVDVMLMHALLEAVPERSAMLVVGDVDQLPSVGPGQVLADA
jgi:tRNA(Met) C34 N-acetyltransferase TmcA